MVGDRESGEDARTVASSQAPPDRSSQSIPARHAANHPPTVTALVAAFMENSDNGNETMNDEYINEDPSSPAPSRAGFKRGKRPSKVLFSNCIHTYRE